MSHTIIIKDSVALYVDAKLTDTMAVLKNAIDPNTRTDNAYQITVDSLPAYYQPGGWTWDGEKLSPLPWYVEEILPTVKADKAQAIDAETSAAILAGFDYTIDPGTGTPETLHFSYDSFDQQNFADSANVATLAMSGTPGLPTEVTWNAYRNYSPETGGELVRLTLTPSTFLQLYTAGALMHKATQMEIGGQRKAAVEAATTIEDVQAA